MLKKQIFNFILVGILNTLFGYMIYAFFIYLGFKYVLAILFATIFGVLFNFNTIGKFVFNNKDNSALIKFIFVYVVVFGVNVLTIKIFKSYGFNDYISGFFAIIPASIISFVLNKYFVFSEGKNEIN